MSLAMGLVGHAEATCHFGREPDMHVVRGIPLHAAALAIPHGVARDQESKTTNALPGHASGLSWQRAAQPRAGIRAAWSIQTECSRGPCSRVRRRSQGKCHGRLRKLQDKQPRGNSSGQEEGPESE